MPPVPYEIALASYIDRFGVKAVTGKDTLSASEINRIIVSEKIVDAYKSREASGKEWGKWAAAHPDLDEFLKQIEKELHGSS